MRFNKELFREKYRIKSTRLLHYDYSGDGWYFITICTKNMVNYFGEIREQVMGLSDIGCITTKYWQDIPNHFNNVRLDEWVIMPNHVHGIIIIDKSQIIVPNNVETCHGMSLRGERLNKFGSPISNSLSMIINHFKGAVTRWCNKNGYPFKWQSRYYDHIIESDRELHKIREYIFYNPQM